MQKRIQEEQIKKLNYDIFWRLSDYLDVQSIHNLSNTCKKLKTFKDELKTCLVQRMFHKITFIQQIRTPWIILLKMFNCLESRFKGNSCINKIIIFALNESYKKSNIYSTFVMEIYNAVIENANLNDLILNFILVHGNEVHNKLLIEKIFKAKIININQQFNLQNLFNAILTLQDIDFLNKFHFHFPSPHIMITRKYLRKIIIAKNVIFFENLVKLFIGDLIKLNLYQSCIKECIEECEVTQFDKYINSNEK